VNDDEAVKAFTHLFVSAGERALTEPLPLVAREEELRVREAVHDLPGFDEADAEIAALTVRLALLPRSMTRERLAPLRDAGLDDRAIHDAVNVAACFSYMNRLADGLGVTLEPQKLEWSRFLMGEEATDAHLAWGARGEP
jgi:hypothetical protein